MATNYNSLAGAAAVAAVIGASASGLVSLYGYGTQGTGPVMRAISADQTALVNGSTATGKKIYVAATADNQSLSIGGQVFVARGTGIDAGVQPDSTIAVNCGGDACSAPASSAATFAAAINGQTSNANTAGPPDGGVGYFAAKDAGLTGNRPIGGTLGGAATGMTGGTDPATRGGPTTGYVANAFDPSVSGLIAPVGTFARTVGGTKAWEKVGTGNNAWVEVGNFAVHD